ncbi:hypothetical protein [Verrucosispora sp. WMMD573]|uniref:hypothetical protein n=1 Tax=Verrucosispora sp. WMMD573 TaxID=3015149 RepID=UPI00248CC647|nr:hypothetical protein [Verrucosispora sp. WMMD573]WBB55880.1 hypothetical protein O7601_07330 [Verrucosispora sp. WMMD573]
MTMSLGGGSGADPPPLGAADGPPGAADAEGPPDALGSAVGDGSLDALGAADAEGPPDGSGSADAEGSVDAVGSAEAEGPVDGLGPVVGGSSDAVGSAEAVGGSGSAVGVGEPLVGAGEGERLGVGAGRGAGVLTGGRGAGAVAGASGRRAGGWAPGVPTMCSRGVGTTGLTGGAAGSTDGTAVTVDVGEPVGGGGTTTGPMEGVGMNGVLPSGTAVLPTVAEPVLIAARTGIEAVPASSATVSR